MAKLYSMAQWFMQQLTRELDPDEENTKRENLRVVAFQLYHVTGNGREEELFSITVGTKKWSGKELADRFDSTAATHASGLSGRQQYNLKAIFADETVAAAQFPFGKAGENNDIGLGTEGPTQQGFMAQMMRHVETYAKLLTVHSEAMMTRMGEMVETLSDHNQKLMAQNADAFEVIKDVIVEKAKAEHENQAGLLEYERKTKQQQMLLSLLPGLLNKLTGINLLPQSSLAEVAIQQLKETLTPEQLARIADILSPEQMVPILQMLNPEGGGQEPPTGSQPPQQVE